MNYRKYFDEHLVFTILELRTSVPKEKVKAIHNNLKYYLNKGKICSIKRGVYCTVPEGNSPDKYQPNNILLTSRMSKDAVVSFHSALELMGYGHSIFRRFFYYTDSRKRPFHFKDNEFISIMTPRALRKKNLKMIGVEEDYYNNMLIRFTNRERTLVDCLDKPEYAGGIEEVYRCIEKYPYVNFKEIINYLDAIRKGVLYARVGFFLQQHKKHFFVEDSLLRRIKKNIPSSIVYFDPQRKKGKLVKEWNLVVPEVVIRKGWEEF